MQQHKIRFAGIDAPEKVQPFGSKSQTNLGQMVFNKKVTADCPKRDRYGRELRDQDFLFVSWRYEILDLELIQPGDLILPDGPESTLTLEHQLLLSDTDDPADDHVTGWVSRQEINPSRSIGGRAVRHDRTGLLLRARRAPLA